MRHLAPWALTLLFRSLGSPTSIEKLLIALCAIGFWHALGSAAAMAALSRQRPSTLLLGDFGERGSSHSFLRFLGFPQRAKALHVLANRDGSLLDIRYRAHTLLPGARRCLLARATLTGDGSADFLLTIFPVQTLG
jgi:hypothetical protein